MDNFNVSDKIDYSSILFYFALVAYCVAGIIIVFALGAQRIEKNIPKARKLKTMSAWFALIGNVLLITAFVINMITEKTFTMTYILYITLVLFAFAFNIVALVNLHSKQVEEETV